ncbi:hypothetical protein, partial [Microvirga tunisiensis]|uniref:hypothetical protein n=1 Tax=Microvirga tunisiensis TaxID=2108360 RepID=UPI001AED4A6B
MLKIYRTPSVEDSIMKRNQEDNLHDTRRWRGPCRAAPIDAFPRRGPEIPLIGTMIILTHLRLSSSIPLIRSMAATFGSSPWSLP